MNADSGSRTATTGWADVFDTPEWQTFVQDEVDRRGLAEHGLLYQEIAGVVCRTAESFRAKAQSSGDHAYQRIEELEPRRRDLYAQWCFELSFVGVGTDQTVREYHAVKKGLEDAIADLQARTAEMVTIAEAEDRALRDAWRRVEALRRPIERRIRDRVVAKARSVVESCRVPERRASRSGSTRRRVAVSRRRTASTASNSDDAGGSEPPDPPLRGPHRNRVEQPLALSGVTR